MRRRYKEWHNGKLRQHWTRKAVWWQPDNPADSVHIRLEDDSGTSELYARHTMAGVMWRQWITDDLCRYTIRLLSLDLIPSVVYRNIY